MICKSLATRAAIYCMHCTTRTDSMIYDPVEPQHNLALSPTATTPHFTTNTLAANVIFSQICPYSFSGRFPRLSFLLLIFLSLHRGSSPISQSTGRAYHLPGRRVRLFTLHLDAYAHVFTHFAASPVPSNVRLPTDYSSKSPERTRNIARVQHFGLVLADQQSTSLQLDAIDTLKVSKF